MTQYIITLEDEGKAKSLITYLKSLDFVKIKPKSTTQPNRMILKNRKKNAKDLKGFLESLPEVDYIENEVLESIKLMRSGKKEN